MMQMQSNSDKIDPNSSYTSEDAHSLKSSTNSYYVPKKLTESMADDIENYFMFYFNDVDRNEQVKLEIVIPTSDII